MNNKEQEDKELIRHITETLREYEIPYREGAWENFVSLGRSTRNVVLWPYLSGAAMLLLAAALFLLKRPEQPALVNSVKVKPNATSPASAGPIADKQKKDVGERHGAISSAKEKIAYATAAQKKQPVNKNEPLQVGAAAKLQTTTEPAADLAALKVRAQQTPENKKEIRTQESRVAEANRTAPENTADQGDRFLQMLKREQSNAEGRQEGMQPDKEKLALNKVKKWDLGIALAPAVTRDRFNFGGGVEVAYRLSNHVSVGTGISMTGLGIQRSGQTQAQYSGGGTSHASAVKPPPSGFYSNTKLASVDDQSQNRQLESVRTSVLGLDIPLNFSYHLNKSFYASAGASFFAIVNETRTNVYVREVPTTKSVNGLSGAAAVQPVNEQQRVSEKTSEQPLSNSNFNGFLNFSVGHRIPLSGKVQLGLEPFMKLPLGRAAKQDVNLSYGGIKLSAGF